MERQRQTWPECTVRLSLSLFLSLSLCLCQSFSKRKLQNAQQMNEIFSRFSHFCRVLDPAPCNHSRRRRRSTSVDGSSTIRFQSEKDYCPVSTYTLLVATTSTRELLPYTFSKKHMCSFLFSSLFYSFCFSPLFIRDESWSQQKRTETAHPKA